jgi:ABC-type branched-subunit amino acid transport system permease subunit
MSNENNKKERVKGFVSGIPSKLSKNRMLLSIIAFLYLLPLVTGAEPSPERDLINVITQIMIFGLLAMSFDLQLGRAGLLNFGQVALFGVGAYFAAFTLNNNIFPELNVIPFLVTLILAMLLGAAVGLVMGLTTSRMRGTAFAFIALAIAMFLYNFFAQNQVISGGETGLRVSTPDIMRSPTFYVFFVAISFVVLAAFSGMIILYVKKRTESIGALFFTPVMIAFVGILLLFGTNILGPILVSITLVGMFVLHWMERNRSTSNPFQFMERKETTSGDVKSTSILTKLVLPLSILVITMVGVYVAFETNIVELASIWITQPGSVFLYRIPIQYYLVLTCVVMTYVFIGRLVASPFGRMVTAVAQNEERAKALGYNSYHCKIIVVVISGAIAGLAGALYAPYIRTIDPTTALGVEVSINAMLYTIIGGLGTLFGPLLGSGIVRYSELNLVDLLGELWLVGLGVIYIIIVLFLPLGIVGSASTKTRALKERLQRVKIGNFEFGIKESDYWVFALLGMIGLFLLLLFVTTL